MLNACTIIACNYFPFAKVLAESFLAHHPGGRFTVLLVDDEGGDFTPGPLAGTVTWLRLADIGLDPTEIRRLAGIYDVTRAGDGGQAAARSATCWTAARREVIYLDPDIQHLRLARSRSRELARRARHRAHAAHDAAVAAGRASRSTASTSSRRASTTSGSSPSARARAAVPRLVVADDAARGAHRRRAHDVHRSALGGLRARRSSITVILKDPGYNVAYWNLHGRDAVRSTATATCVNGVPLQVLSLQRLRRRRKPLAAQQASGRSAARAPQRAARRSRSSAATTARALRGRRHRHRARAAVRLEHAAVRHSVHRRGCAGSIGARSWRGAGQRARAAGSVRRGAARARSSRGSNVARRGGARRDLALPLCDLYASRVDLQHAFPRHLRRRRAPGSAIGSGHDGVVAGDIPPELLPPERGDSPAPTRSAARRSPRASTSPATSAPKLGIGEAARLLTRAVEAAGSRTRRLTYDGDAAAARPTRSSSAATEGVPRTTSTCCASTPTSTPRFARDVGPGVLRGPAHRRLLVLGGRAVSADACTRRSTPSTRCGPRPTSSPRRCGRSDASRSSRVPLPVPVPRVSPGITRDRLGLPERFMFLFVFDFLSVFERKNPLGLIEAFTAGVRARRRAAPRHQDHQRRRCASASSNGCAAAVGHGPTCALVDELLHRRTEKNALLGAVRLLRVAAPVRGAGPDDGGGDGARQAGHRDRLLRATCTS